MAVYKINESVEKVKKESTKVFGESVHRVVEGRHFGEGSRFTNSGFEWKVLDSKGDYTLVYSKDKKVQPYVVAYRLDDDGSWGQGHYFNDERAAKAYFKKVTKGLEEDTVRDLNSDFHNIILKLDKIPEDHRDRMLQGLYAELYDFWNEKEDRVNEDEVPDSLKKLVVQRYSHLLKEDTVKKRNGKWTNRGDDGTEHGEFDTKAEADAQRKAMFAQGYKGESLDEKLNLTSEGKALKRAIKNIVVDSDDELREFVSAIVEEVISENNLNESIKEDLGSDIAKYKKRVNGEEYPWYISDSVTSDGFGLFLTRDGRYKKQHYSQADTMTFEDAKVALDKLNSKLTRPAGMNYFMESSKVNYKKR